MDSTIIVSMGLLTLFCGVMIYKHIVGPFFNSVYEPLTLKNLEFSGKQVVAIHYGRMTKKVIDVSKIDDFTKKYIEMMETQEPFADQTYLVQIGFYPDLTSGGRTIHSEMVCYTLHSAYITARAKQYILQNEIENDGVYYRITKTQLS